jgi:integrase
MRRTQLSASTNVALPPLVATMGLSTSGDFQAALTALNEAAGQGAAPRMAVTFEQVALQYIALSEPRWGVHAAATTKSVIRRHLIAKLGGLTLDKLNTKDLQAFVDDVARNNASDSLLHKVVTHLRAILDLAQESGVLRVNPMRNRIAKVCYRSQRPASERHLSFEECGALLAELAGRDFLIVRMFIQLGLRPKELFALRRDDVKGKFLRIDEVLIRGRVKKIGGEGVALGVYVPPDLLVQLANWMRSTRGLESDWLFPASRSRGTTELPPISQDHFRSRVLKRAAEKAGVPDVDLFAFRRTCASFFAHQATAQDTLAQMRRYDVELAGESGRQALSSSLQRAADKIEAQILKATNQAKKSEDGPNRATSRIQASGAKNPR